MIQRIQTVYLLIIAIGSIWLAATPLFTLVPGELATDTHIYTFSFLNVMSLIDNKEILFMRNWTLLALDILVFALALITIFGYKNRRKQQQWCAVISMLSIFLMGLTLYTINTIRVSIGAAHSLHFSWIAILIVILPIFALLAKRAIKKDDDLVRSADRLR